MTDRRDRADQPGPGDDTGRASQPSAASATFPPQRYAALVIATILIAAAAGFGAVYVIAGAADNANGAARGGSPTPVQRQAQNLEPSGSRPAAELPSGPGRNALSTGEMAAFVFKKTPEELPVFSFLDKDGKERTLADWRGRVVLLNLWATWCLPCRKEMPALDRLQAELGSETFEVVAVSVDRTGLEGARKFLDGIKVSRLALYADPTVRLTSTLKSIGMPATLLLNKEGREIGRLVGPAEWDSPEAKALIKATGG